MHHAERRGERPASANWFVSQTSRLTPAVRLCFVLCVLCLVPLQAAEEAWRSDGRRLLGQLTLDSGKLHFQPTEGATLAPADLRRVRFAEGKPAPFRIGAGRRVRLWSGEQLSGQILALNAETLQLRTAWARRLELPRAALASIESLPGWRTLLDTDFSTDAKTFTMTGSPARIDAEDGTSARALLLRAAGQSVGYPLKSPLSKGRVGVNFQEREQPSGGRWILELLFQHDERTRRVTITVAGNGEHYRVDTSGLAGTARKVARTPGWHRLIVQFGRHSLRLTCDDDVLWYNLDQGPGGSLRRVTLACEEAPEGKSLRGAVAWTELSIEQGVVEYPPPPADSEQDAVRLRDDDQLFGRIVQADRRILEIRGRFGKRVLPWTTLSGCSFSVPSLPKGRGARGEGGEKVQLLFHSGLSADADVLEGVVTALDGQKLMLRHELLGELTFERRQLRELRPHNGNSK